MLWFDVLIVWFPTRTTTVYEPSLRPVNDSRIVSSGSARTVRSVSPVRRTPYVRAATALGLVK